MSAHLHSRSLYQSDAIRIEDVDCQPFACRAGGEEHVTAPCFAFVRSGVFVRHTPRGQSLLDENHIVLFNAMSPYRVSHPVLHGDKCTVFHLDRATLLEAIERHDPSVVDRPDQPFLADQTTSSAPACLGCQMLRRHLQHLEADELAVEELVMDILSQVVRLCFPSNNKSSPKARPSTERFHRDLVEHTKLELAQRFAENVTLQDLARSVASSPFHLTRLFRRQTGVPVYRYLMRLRLRKALECIADGESDLMALALRLGFSSHSHFSNAFRTEFGVAPSWIRHPTATVRFRETSKMLQA